MENSKSNNRSAFIIVTTLFFMWGFITVLVDALIPKLKDVFELSYFESGLVQFSFFMAYFFVSIPSGSLIAKIGYKKGVIVGLLTMGAGCLLFFPAASLRLFPIFLLALFVLASGITILQVAANPYVAALGPSKSASSRLNLSQAFNSLGTTLAPLVSAAFILGNSVATSDEVDAMSTIQREAYYVAEASSVQIPFLALSIVLVVLAGIFAVFKLPKILEGKESKGGNYFEALKSKPLMYGAIGIFLYVGAEVTIGSYLVNYFLTLDVRALVDQSSMMSSLASFLSGSDITAINVSRLAGTFVFFYWFGAMIGRFIGAGLQLKFKPAYLLSVYALINVCLLVLTILSSSYVAFWTVLSIGLFNSIMFPTIFTLSIDGLKNNTAQGSGILCTAIVGGAFIPPLYGYFADLINLQTAFIIPLLCYLYIAWYGKYASE